MIQFIERLTGMDALTDQMVAMDLLNSAKSGARNLAMAVTDAGTPEIKEMLTRHLEATLDLHEEISTYIMKKGWYHAWNTEEQTKLNLQNMETALKLPTL
ncbi:spore coat protein [Bacillus infantis]|uniref:spore coat protein n=1 Tax=Bacillus infantis TaxID=324767 RepID=UPI001CD3D2D9|nr:spore coat protein [Bacillus infantis]MCA1040096.1 spore coat protein [Bacillus infantis]